MIKIISLHSNKQFILCNGESLVLGRGDETGCFDKRVSRKHGELTYSETDGLLLLALHSNPCFIMRGGTPPVLILKKDEKITLKPGDYIALLPDATWFQVIGGSLSDVEIPQDDPPSPCFLVNGSLSDVQIPQDDPQSPCFVVNGSPDAKASIAYSGTRSTETPKQINMESIVSDDDIDDCSTPDSIIIREENGQFPMFDSTCDVSNSENKIVTTESVANEHVNTLAITSLQGPERVSSVSSPVTECSRSQGPVPVTDTINISPSTVMQSDLETPVKSEKILERPSLVLPYSPPFIVPKNSSKIVIPSKTKDMFSGTGTGTSCSKKKRKLPLWMYDIDGDAPRTKASTSSTSEVQQINSQTQDLSSSMEVKESISDTVASSAIQETGGLSHTVVKTEDQNLEHLDGASSTSSCTPAPVKEEIEVGTSTVPSDSDSTNQQQATTTSRPLCIYEGSCYRRNLQHRADFSHPGDSDWIPTEQRPPCPYGRICYRRNQSHRVSFYHPPRTRGLRHQTLADVALLDNSDSEPYQTDEDSEWSSPDFAGSDDESDGSLSQYEE